MEGVTVTVNAEECIGCGLCREICFIKAININDGKCSLNPDMCRGCGRCVEVCPRDAIELDFDESLVNGEIERISGLVNL